ncbi:MAG: hypothetical protein JXQ68_01640 [Campylobacterales bacterium]|nr:hypothetical protein [Campylobacterales bacterium]
MIKKRQNKKIFLHFLTLLFVVFYPMLISIHVFFPLLIGYAGYMLVYGISKNSRLHIFFAVFYLLNLDFNLSLPIALSIIASLLVYIFIYTNKELFLNCKLCQIIFNIVVIDFVYILLINIYDFVFETNSIDMDLLLLYSLVIDIIMAVTV